MPRNFFKKYMPSHRKVREHKYLKAFGDLLHEPNLWHLNRYSASGAVAVGLFVSAVPLPMQMVLAAAIAIFIRVNLPIAIGLTWVSNPVTMPPLYFFAYKVGAWILGVPAREIHFELSIKWLSESLSAIWEPFLLGCFILGVTGAATGYVLVRWLWRLSVIRNWDLRKLNRSIKLKQKKKP
jgi:uncharacterized protein (DUF2062 family)